MQLLEAVDGHHKHRSRRGSHSTDSIAAASSGDAGIESEVEVEVGLEEQAEDETEAVWDEEMEEMVVKVSSMKKKSNTQQVAEVDVDCGHCVDDLGR